MPLNSNKKSSRKAKILPQFSISPGNRPLLDLLEIQRKSFFDFLEHGIPHELAKTGIFRETAKNSIFTRELELVLNPETYTFISPNSTPKQAILKGKTYACKLYVQATLMIKSHNPEGFARQQTSVGSVQERNTTSKRICLNYNSVDSSAAYPSSFFHTEGEACPLLPKPKGVRGFASTFGLLPASYLRTATFGMQSEGKVCNPYPNLRIAPTSGILSNTKGKKQGKNALPWAFEGSGVDKQEQTNGMLPLQVCKQKYPVIPNLRYARSVRRAGFVLNSQHILNQCYAKLIPNVYAKWIKKGFNNTNFSPKISDLEMTLHSAAEELQARSVSKKNLHSNTVTKLKTLTNSRLTRFTRKLEMKKTENEFFSQVIRREENKKRRRSCGLLEMNVSCTKQSFRLRSMYNNCLFRKAASFGVRSTLKQRNKEEIASMEVTWQTPFNSFSKNLFTYLSLSNTWYYLRYISNLGKLPSSPYLSRPPVPKATITAMKMKAKLNAYASYFRYSFGLPLQSSQKAGIGTGESARAVDPIPRKGKDNNRNGFAKPVHFSTEGRVWFATPLFLGSKKYVEGFYQSQQIPSSSWIAPHHQSINFLFPSTYSTAYPSECEANEDKHSLPTCGFRRKQSSTLPSDCEASRRNTGGRSSTLPLDCEASRKLGYGSNDKSSVSEIFGKPLKMKKSLRSSPMLHRADSSLQLVSDIPYLLLHTEGKAPVRMPYLRYVEAGKKQPQISALQAIPVPLGSAVNTEGKPGDKTSVSKVANFSMLDTSLVEKKDVQIFRPWIFLGELPLMTKRGHFILNGSPRVIVNQIARCPGIYFQEKRRGVGFEQEVRVSADLIPQRGPWLRIQSDWEGRFWARLKQEGRVKYATLYEAFQEFEKQYNAPLVSLLASRSSSFPKSEIIAFQERKTKEDKQKKALTRLFKNSTRYSLGKLGRIRINQRIHFRPLYEFSRLGQNILLSNLSTLLLASLQKLVTLNKANFFFKKNEFHNDSATTLASQHTSPFAYPLLLKPFGACEGTLGGIAALQAPGYPRNATIPSEPEGSGMLPLPPSAVQVCKEGMQTKEAKGYAENNNSMLSDSLENLTPSSYPFHTLLKEKWNHKSAITTEVEHQRIHTLQYPKGKEGRVYKECEGKKVSNEYPAFASHSESKEEPNFLLMAKDIDAIHVCLERLLEGQGFTDDIDHLKNRFIRTSGKLLQQQFELGLHRLTEVITPLLKNLLQSHLALLTDSDVLPTRRSLRNSKIAKGSQLPTKMNPSSMGKVHFSTEGRVNKANLVRNKQVESHEVSAHTNTFAMLIFGISKKRNNTVGKRVYKPFTYGIVSTFGLLPASYLRTATFGMQSEGKKHYKKFETNLYIPKAAQGTEGTASLAQCEAKELFHKVNGKQRQLPYPNLRSATIPSVTEGSGMLPLPPSAVQVCKEGMQTQVGKEFEGKRNTSQLRKPSGYGSTVTPFRWLRTSKPINGAFREFFGSNPLSQYMDQTNPLAEITHKRRLSSMGPGGIKRETAGMEVRGIHPTHYGRVCPIETPEGKNAGLVNSPTVYGRIGTYGFLETPLYQVLESQVQSKRWAFFSAQQEEDEIRSLATCDTGLQKFNLLAHVPIPVQTANNPLAHFQQVERNRVGYRALSPVQTISIATALIPFLEHDDANRALMGSNMQRQAIPLLLPERPIVGTGFEPLVVVESGQALQTTKFGCVSSINANNIVVHSIQSMDCRPSTYGTASLPSDSEGSAAKKKARALPQSVLRNAIDNELCANLPYSIDCQHIESNEPIPNATISTCTAITTCTTEGGNSGNSGNDMQRGKRYSQSDLLLHTFGSEGKATSQVLWIPKVRIIPNLRYACSGEVAERFLFGVLLPYPNLRLHTFGSEGMQTKVRVSNPKVRYANKGKSSIPLGIRRTCKAAGDRSRTMARSTNGRRSKGVVTEAMKWYISNFRIACATGYAKGELAKLFFTSNNNKALLRFPTLTFGMLPSVCKEGMVSSATIRPKVAITSITTCTTDGGIGGTGMQTKVAIPKLTTTRIRKNHLCSSHSALFLTPVKQTLQPYQRSNQETCLHQRPLVQEGDWVQRGDFLADCSASHLGDLSLGKNVTVAYMPWEGYNFEDAIVISDRLVSDDVYTSLHIERYEIKVNKNSQGKERITNQIPGTSRSLKHLDQLGIARISSWVQPGDILVGKVIELKRPLSPYERLAWELASRLSPASPEREKWLNKVWLEDISLRLPPGICGRVINSQIISTEWSDKEQIAHPLEVHIYLAVKRKIQIGDKLAGRHGNKGIVSTILPQQDMPFLGDGRSIDMVLNPLGVPSRMNLGQIFECLLGLAGSQLGCNFKITPFDEVAGGEASRSLVFLKLYQCRLIYKQQWLFTPTFPGKSKLFDGRTGEPFENWVTVGQAYMLKLIHMVDHKIHARSTGPYSLFTRQPVRGRSRRGGQRLGEMEVWAVEGFGAAYTLQEFLTIKSDDLKARTALQRSFYKQNDVTFGKIHISPGNPEAFKVLISELQALCLHIQM